MGSPLHWTQGIGRVSLAHTVRFFACSGHSNSTIVVLEKNLESSLDCKEIQRVHPKGDQSWVFIGGTHVEAETPILWPPHVKS